MEKPNDLKDSIEPVNIESTTRILDQMMNCICKIKLKGEYGTGFFCKITFEKKIIKVLMTNHHVLNENNFKENKKLNLLLNDEKELRIIDLEIKRETYFNKDYDLAVIELKENDDEIATYKFKGKKIMLYSILTDLREWRRCNLEMAGATSLERVKDDNQTADALIIDGTFYGKKYKDWKDALELQRTNPDFRVFTLSAFGKHYDKVIWPYIHKQIEKIPKGSLKSFSEFAP